MEEPELENPRLAEFVGILLGDGCIGEYVCSSGENVKTQRYVKVTLSGEEKEYAKHVEKLYSELFEVKPVTYRKKHENVIEVRSFRNDIFRFLTKEVGLKTAPKWQRAKIPEKLQSRHKKDILRGLFDTDGCLVLTDNNGTLYPRLEIKISPSPMQQQVQKILRDLDFNFGSYQIGKGKTRIQMNGKKQLEKWLNEIGFNNQRHLNKLKKLG